MLKLKLSVILLFLISCFYVNEAFSQEKNLTLKGIILDDKGLPLSNVKVELIQQNSKIKKSKLTNEQGVVEFPNLEKGKYTINIHHLTFEDKTIDDFELSSTNNEFSSQLASTTDDLQSIVLTTGTRTAPRTNTSSPLPIDVIGIKDIKTTAQPSLDKALNFTVPAFNTVNTPVNDATTLLDPYEIRNLGPSRSLILINGKRKNLSSLLYVQFSPGRGEVGADLNAIPIDAIERIEVLRDGASAQYGSDAIAGVVNVILKSKLERPTLNLIGGVTSKGDGANYHINYTSGLSFNKKGFFNYTIGVSNTENAVRSGIIDVPTEIATFGNRDLPINDVANSNIVNYLKKYPTGNNQNGTGATKTLRFLYNAGIPINENTELYSNAAIVVKKVISNANFRQPYWLKDYGLLHTPDPNGVNYTDDLSLVPGTNTQLYAGYIGYEPTFEGDLTDYNATLGLKQNKNDWFIDMSFTTGGNSQIYDVRNTVNHGLQAAGPINYKPGGYAFNHIVGNLDITKRFNNWFSLAFGSEFRKEWYTIIAGDTASVINPPHSSGANSFPGIAPQNAGTWTRYNIGEYIDFGFDATENLLFNLTLRNENYSDFGSTNVGKVSGRYNIEDKFTIRSSFSTGFRAPSLHQIYAQSTQASFADGIISLSGLFNNQSKQAKSLGIPKLKPEQSRNFTLGFGFNPNRNINLTVDYYDILISDRIVLSSSISSDDPQTELYKILQSLELRNISFFINALKTYTSGLDLVFNYRNINLGSAQNTLGINFAGNYQIKNEVLGKPETPKAIADGGASILSSQITSLLTQSRPAYKLVQGLDFRFNNFQFYLNNTLFGPTSFQDLDNGGSIMNHIKQEFQPALVTDLNFSYNFTKAVSLTVSVNNVFNILPKWKLVGLDKEGTDYLNDNTLDPNLGVTQKHLLEGFLSFSGRYRILGYNGSQFSQLGTIFNTNLTIRF